MTKPRTILATIALALAATGCAPWWAQAPTWRRTSTEPSTWPQTNADARNARDGLPSAPWPGHRR